VNGNSELILAFISVDKHQNYDTYEKHEIIL
jgi:hypothetical protein